MMPDYSGIQLPAAVEVLREARAELAAAKAEHDAVQEAVRKQHALVIGRYERAQKTAIEADGRVRALALCSFVLDRVVDPVPGVLLKRFEAVEYEDGKASEWAREHALWWLFKLDGSSFEKMVKAAAPGRSEDGAPRVPAEMPFVTIRDDWRPQIAAVLP